MIGLVRALLLACALAPLAACRGGDELPGLGQRCTLLCKPGLMCGPDGYCEGRCVCDGGPTCVPATLGEGCTPDGVCVVVGGEGRGSCRVKCNDSADCPEGQPGCMSGPDTTRACVGDGFVWTVPDLRISD